MNKAIWVVFAAAVSGFSCWQAWYLGLLSMRAGELRREIEVEAATTAPEAGFIQIPGLVQTRGGEDHLLFLTEVVLMPQQNSVVLISIAEFAFSFSIEFYVKLSNGSFFNKSRLEKPDAFASLTLPQFEDIVLLCTRINTKTIWGSPMVGGNVGNRVRMTKCMPPPPHQFVEMLPSLKGQDALVVRFSPLTGEHWEPLQLRVRLDTRMAGRAVTRVAAPPWAPKERQVEWPRPLHVAPGTALPPRPLYRGEERYTSSCIGGIKGEMFLDYVREMVMHHLNIGISHIYFGFELGEDDPLFKRYCAILSDFIAERVVSVVSTTLPNLTFGWSDRGKMLHNQWCILHAKEWDDYVVVHDVDEWLMINRTRATDVSEMARKLIATRKKETCDIMVKGYVYSSGPANPPVLTEEMLKSGPWIGWKFPYVPAGPQLRNFKSIHTVHTWYASYHIGGGCDLYPDKLPPQQRNSRTDNDIRFYIKPDDAIPYFTFAHFVNIFAQRVGPVRRGNADAKDYGQYFHVWLPLARAGLAHRCKGLTSQRQEVFRCTS
mmetsp:Transcript_11930/g.32253  ORF Transcript_11930/g.32253 Transcript_11930/m.32253 type:complete len:545 (+) Transcript_11930:47-1681(+)